MCVCALQIGQALANRPQLRAPAPEAGQRPQGPLAPVPPPPERQPRACSCGVPSPLWAVAVDPLRSACCPLRSQSFVISAHLSSCHADLFPSGLADRAEFAYQGAAQTSSCTLERSTFTQAHASMGTRAAVPAGTQSGTRLQPPAHAQATLWCPCRSCGRKAPTALFRSPLTQLVKAAATGGTFSGKLQKGLCLTHRPACSFVGCPWVLGRLFQRKKPALRAGKENPVPLACPLLTRADHCARVKDPQPLLTPQSPRSIVSLRAEVLF